MRRTAQIDYMIDDLQRQLEEIKEKQFFGADALHIKKYTKRLFMEANNTTGRLFKITMINESPGHTIPLFAKLLPISEDESKNSLGLVKVSTDGDNFIFWAELTKVYQENDRSCDFVVKYCGKASFEAEEL